MNKQDSENRQVREFVYRFFHNYYTERSPVKVLEMVDDQVVCIGLGSEELGTDKKSFTIFMCEQMLDITRPLPYTVTEYLQNACAPGCWVIFARVQIKVASQEWGKVIYNLRMTATVHRSGEALRFSHIHVSESADSRKDLLSLGYNTLTRQPGEPDHNTKEELNKLISQLIPGGVVSCYAEDGFPLAVANEQVLHTAGYATYREFYQMNGGHYLNAIHPEDWARYRYNVRFIQQSGKQCECEYRIRRRDGCYIWVHDVGRRAQSDDGRPMIVSALYDISDQVAQREKLEMESGIDVLTGVYNRKGARKRIDTLAPEMINWAFFVVDLDNFKRVNDFYGHKQGDQILCYVAGLMKQKFGDTGTVFRLGGDEFSIFIHNYRNISQLQQNLESVSESYTQLLQQVCPKAESSLSVGGVYGNGRQDFDEIYERADENLYRVKHRIKGQVRVSAFENL